MMAIAPESLRAAMAMAVRVGAPRSHAFTFLRSPFGISLSKRPCNRFSPLPRWLKSSLHTTPALRFKPSYAVPVVSSVQDAMAKPVTKSAGLDLANEALDFTKSSQEGSSEESELEEGELAELPEELREDLESTVWSVGLDGLNVTDVPSSACVLGIDPDASGAIAVLRAANQEVLDVPCVKVQIGKTMRRRHDASSIVDLVNKINAPEGSVAYVEQAMPFPKDGKQGWYGCGFGYGMWVGILMALGFKVVPVRAQAWKSAMGISGRQYTKDDSRNVAMALFPDLRPQLKRKKDHGRADAILIAAFGKGLTPPPKILIEDTELIQID